jgi:hypothetical protein
VVHSAWWVCGFESLTFGGHWADVVHGHWFESLPFWGQWCSAWSCVQIFVFLGSMLV